MGDERLPNKRQQQAAATRERMLNAAREVFETRGFRAASVGAITQAADTAHGTFYLYFSNKEDAFIQVIESVGLEFERAQRSGLTLRRRAAIEAVLRGFVDVFVAHRGLWRALLEGMLQSNAVERVWIEVRAGLADGLARGLEREQQAGAVRDFDAAQSAEALASMAEWYAFTHLMVGDAVADAEAVDRVVAVLTDLWFNAVYGRAVS
jgi:AcrR family transcriptional regulator